MPSTPEVSKVADAVAAQLNAGVAVDAFSQDFAAARSFISETKLEDLGTLHVDVVPVTPAAAIEARFSLGCMNQVDVAVRKRFEGVSLDATTGKPTNAAVDALLYLEQEIFVYLAEHKTLGTYSDASFVAVEVRAAWVPEDLNGNQQFTGILRVTYHTSLSLQP
jgi:hypothetical protein